jgi:hypothetical protein
VAATVGLAASFVWGAWHGFRGAGVLAIVLTSAAIAAIFIFYERDTIRRHEGHDLIAPWNRGAIWRRRISVTVNRSLIFLIATAISCAAQGVGYAVIRFL